MIYLLEDDDAIRKLVTYGLESQGYAARGFALPSEFWKAMDAQRPELLLLDLMLPEEDGLSILRKLRSAAATKKLPVIILTAKNAEYDRVIGLDGGADDFISKPFGMMELLARVRAVLRRAEPSSAAEASMSARSSTSSASTGVTYSSPTRSSSCSAFWRKIAASSSHAARSWTKSGALTANAKTGRSTSTSGRSG